ncbi:VWA domain-containing protein [Candidatus Poribacteria bacterium]|nr:VWA domain-containing protein [Candidatus Poribacteria bacterium]
MRRMIKGKNMVHIKRLRTRIRVTVLTVVLGMAAPFGVSGATGAINTKTITIQPPLVYKGHNYTVEYQTTGNYQHVETQRFFAEASTPDFPQGLGITALTVRRDGVPITDEDELRTVFTIYNAARVLYERPADASPGTIYPGFREDLNQVTGNSILIAQQAVTSSGSFFKSRQDKTLETLRAMLTPQVPQSQVKQLAQSIRQQVEQSNTVIDALDDVLKVMKFSNSRTIRDLQKNIREVFKDWRPVTEQGTAYIDIGSGHHLQLANALEVISLGIQLLWTADLDPKRAEWLRTFQSKLAGINIGFDPDESMAADMVWKESQDASVQRANIILGFAREKAVDAVTKLGTEELTRMWVEWSWQTFGKRTTGHWIAGAATQMDLGLILGNLLYGLDDLYTNFTLAERADHLRETFRNKRIALEFLASSRGKATYDGNLAEAFRVSYMLEALAIAQEQRSYADGVAATVRKGLLEQLNPINWFRGDDWRAAVEELRKQAAQDERTAEEYIGHPTFVDMAIALATQNTATIPANAINTSTMFAVDVSESMKEIWQGKTKLQAAQTAVQQVLDLIAMEAAGTNQHQAGLVTFSGSAEVVRSLTSDWNALRNSLQALQPTARTNLGEGLKAATQSLKVTLGEKIIILLSDGLTNEGLSREEILSGPAQEAARAKLKVYTVGMGDPSQLDEALLRGIAESTGGAYYHAADAQQLVQVYRRVRHQAVGDIVLEDTGTVRQGETTPPRALVIRIGAYEFHLSLSWPGSELDIVLVDPQGRSVDNQYPGAKLQHLAAQKYLVINNPVLGTWKASVFGKSVPEGSTSYQLLASVRRPQVTAMVGGSAVLPPTDPTAMEILFMVFAVLSILLLIAIILLLHRRRTLT